MTDNQMNPPFNTIQFASDLSDSNTNTIFSQALPVATVVDDGSLQNYAPRPVQHRDSFESNGQFGRGTAAFYSSEEERCTTGSHENDEADGFLCHYKAVDRRYDTNVPDHTDDIWFGPYEFFSDIKLKLMIGLIDQYYSIVLVDVFTYDHIYSVVCDSLIEEEKRVANYFMQFSHLPLEPQNDNFLPYNPDVPIFDQVKQFQHVRLSASFLLDLGWPRYVVEIILKNQLNGKKLWRENPRRQRGFIQNNGSYKTVRFHKNVSVVPDTSGQWVVPRINVRYRLLNSRSSHADIKSYILGTAFCMYEQSSNPLQCVIGNDAARALYFGADGMSNKYRQHLIGKIAIFYSQAVRDTRVEQIFRTRMCDFIPTNVLCWRNDVVDDYPKYCALLQELDYVKRLDLIRLVKRFYANDLDISKIKLQRALDLVPSVTFQGAVLSGHMTIDHNVNFNFNFSEAIGVAQNFGMDEQRARSAVSIFTFIISLVTSTSWNNCLACIATFALKDDYVYSKCKSFIKSLPVSIPQLQSSVSNFGKQIWDQLGFTAVYTAVLTFVREFFGAVSDVIVPTITDLIKQTKKSLIVETAAGIAKWLMAWISDIIGRIKMAYELKSLDPLWGDRWNPRKWVEEAQCMKNNYTVLALHSDVHTPEERKIFSKLREANTITAKWHSPVTVPVFFDIAKQHLNEGETMVKYYKNYPQICNELSQAIKEFKNFLSTVEMQSMGQRERVVPLFVVLDGPPGVGKTSMCSEILAALAIKHGLDASLGTYQWQSSVNFQDGLNHTHWAIIMDDVDQGVASPVAGLRTYAEEIIALVNNKPYPVECADVSMKGKVFANPLIVIMCTNSCNVEGIIRTEHAFYRRAWRYVDVKVKPAYCTPNTQLLDPTYATAHPSHDMYDLVVYPYRKGQQKGHFKGLPCNYSFPEFNRSFQHAFTMHLDRQLSMLSRRGTVVKVCPICGLNASIPCGCRDMSLMHRIPQPYMAELEFLMERKNLGIFNLQGGVIGKCQTRCKRGAHQFVEDLDDHMSFSTYIVNRSSNVLGKVVNKAKWNVWLQVVLMDLFVNYVKFFALSLAVNVVLDMLTSKLDQENATLQGRVDNANGAEVKNFYKVEQTFVPHIPGIGYSPNPTFTKEDIIYSLQQSYVLVKGEMKDKSGYGQVHGFIVAPGVVLTVSHIIPDIIVQNSKECKVPKDTVLILGTGDSQLMLVRCPELSHSLSVATKVWPVIIADLSNFDEVELWTNKLEYKPASAKISRYAPGLIELDREYTKGGDCGSAYLVRNGKSWFIAGFHYATIPKGKAIFSNLVSAAAITTRNELTQALSIWGRKPENVRVVMQSLTTAPKDVVIGSYSPNSEVLAAMTLGYKSFPLGRLDPAISGSTMKTKIKRSMIAPYFEEYELLHCGRKDYWQLPNFRGKMVLHEDGHDYWESPFTKSFDHYNEAMFNTDIALIAFADYIHGIQDLSVEGFSVLSDLTCVVGKDGSYINGVNMRTSVGPPYNVNKRKHIVIEEDRKSAYFSPEVDSMRQTIESIVLAGDIPSVLGLCVLKDEAVKPDKKPRVFTCLPYAYNHVLKKYGSGWKSFIRAHPAKFECMVGIDMTSIECNSIVRMYKTLDPNLEHVKDTDAEAMDKSWSQALWYVVADIVYALSFVINVEPDINRRLILGLANTVFCIKSDIFKVPWNPSGNDMTVELNSLLMSFMERYVYYRTHPWKGDIEALKKWKSNFLNDPIVPECFDFDFQLHNVLITYGDDNQKTTDYEVSPMYAQIFKEELGFIVTAGDKSKDFKDKPFSECTFLKRRQVFESRLQFYVPQLDMKSIVRMLVIKKDSVLSDSDHACVSMYEALREMVYYGEEEYNKMLAIVRQVMLDFHLQENPNIRFRPYSYWFEQLQAGTYCSWNFRSNVSDEDILKNLEMLADSSNYNLPESVYQEDEALEYPLKYNFQMSNLNFIKVADSQPTEENSVKFPVSTSSIVGSGVVEASLAEETPIITQQMKEFPLDDFLMRPVRIQTSNLANTDVPFSVTVTFDPWALWAANAAVVQKLANYTYIRGTLQVIGVVSFPGGAYGRYVASALPQGGVAAAPISDNLLWQNCMQVDHYVGVDCSEATNFVLQLPFISPYDYSNINSALGNTTSNMWTVNLTCLVPVSTSVAGGSTAGAIQWYANLLDDYELAVPNLQSKVLRPNKAMDTFVPHEEVKMSSVAGAVAKGAEAISSVPVIGPFASVVGSVARGAESVLSFFGFSREFGEQAPKSVIAKSVTNIAHIDGTDSSELASLMINNKISPDSRLSGFSGADPCATADLFNRWTIVDTATWSTATTVDTILMRTPVTPMFCTGGAATPNLQGLTPAGYVGLPFAYWRGDMEYMLVVPVSKLHRGTLQIVWVPTNAAPPAVDLTNISTNIIYDVSCGQDLEFGIGYSRELPYLPTTIITHALPVSTWADANGSFMVRVLNPLVSPGGTITTNIVLLARCKNMDFQVVRDVLPYFDATITAANYNMRGQVTYQGLTTKPGAATLGSGGTPEPIRGMLAPMSGEYPGDQMFFGEHFSSVRALMQKPCRIENINGTGGTAANTFVSPYPVPGSPTTCWTFAGHYALLFTGIACSERVKVFTDVPAAIGSCRVPHTVSTAMLYSGTMMPMTYGGFSQAAEFEIPFYRPLKYVLTRHGAKTAMTGQELTAVYYSGATAIATVQGVVFYSFGPDIRVTCFRQVPIVTFRPLVMATSWFP